MEMKSEGERVDDVLMALGGGKAKYQHIQNLLMMLSAFTASFQLLDMIYIGKMVPYQCAPPPNGSYWEDLEGDFILDNATFTYRKCNIDIKYQDNQNRVISRTTDCIFGMEYTQRKDNSLISEFDLVCDREALGDLPQTLIILGQGVGALTLPTFSDRFGRKPTHIISHIAVMAIGIAIAYAPYYTVFAVLRLLIGAVQQGIVLTSATYSIEVFPCKYRRQVGFISSMIWTFAALTMNPIGYFLRDESWRTLQLVFSCCSAVLIFQILFLDESFRWLIANRKYKQALGIVKKAIKMNRANEAFVMDKFHALIGAKHVAKILEPNQSDITLIKGDKVRVVTHPLYEKETEIKLMTSEREQVLEREIPAIKYTLLDILRRKRLAVNVIIFWFLWCTSSLCYFGLTFTSTSLSGDPYLNIFLNLFMELPPAIIFWFMVDRYGRKMTSQLFFGLVGVGLLFATILNTTTDNATGSIFVTIFTLIGKLGATGAFGICFFYTPEFYPTNIRNVGLGSSSIAARVGGMVAPYSRMLSYHIPWGPGVIFGSLSIIATFLLKFLPETKGKQLPQTMDDMKHLYDKTAVAEGTKQTEEDLVGDEKD